MYNDSMFKKLLTIFVIALALLLTYSYFQGDNNSVENDIDEIEDEEIKIPEERVLRFEESPAYENAQYFEGVVSIDNQPMYYAYPLEIQEEKPPELIIYSHGQLQRIVEDLEDEYMLKMREYGDFFASRGYGFSASNQHGDNWGQRESLDDIEKSIIWFEDNGYPISEKKNMLGFSMGGKATINYAIENSNEIAKVALLAPTPKAELTEFDVEKIKDIPIRIWHGTGDVNIPFSTTQQYVQRFENYNKEIDVVPIENAGHFDIETTLMNEILEFFEE